MPSVGQPCKAGTLLVMILACCPVMTHYLDWECDQHASPFDCPDSLIEKDGDDYGLIIHDGGTATIAISYCPWCGQKL